MGIGDGVLDAVFHAEAFGFDEDGFGVVEEAVEDGGGDGGVSVENGGPVFERFVGGEDDGAALVAGADDLEEEVGAALVDGEVADFIQNEQFGSVVAVEFGFEIAFELGGAEGVDDVDSICEKDGMASLTGSVTKGAGQMRLPGPHEPQEDDVGFVLDELKAKKVLDLESVDFLGPVPSESVERFDDGKAGGSDAPGSGAIEALGGFSGDERGEIIEVRLAGFCGFGGLVLAMFFDEREPQLIKVIF